MHDRFLMLADEQVDRATSETVDLLIAADLINDLFYEETTFRLDNGCKAINSFLGWTILGPLDLPVTQAIGAISAASAAVVSASPEETLLTLIKEQWALESLGIESKEKKAPPVEEHPVYKEFVETTQFNGERYVVQLPKKPTAEFRSTNLALAQRRLQSQLNRFKANPSRLTEYSDIFKEQKQAGFIEEVPHSDIKDPQNPVRYLPHLAVLRSDKPSTPVRIVFDGSAFESGDRSLNDELEVGPSTQQDLLKVILNFRMNAVAFVADISKAFLQIGLEAADRDLVRFLWVDDPFKHTPVVKHYRYCRVVFGLSPSPFLLGTVFLLHLNKYVGSEPAVKALRDNRYVDDLATGAEDVDSACKLAEDAVRICDAAGFPLGKFRTHNVALRDRLKGIHSSLDSIQTSEEEASNKCKVFGLIWNLDDDTFGFELSKILSHIEDTKHVVTKRNVLTTSLMLYDRMGLVAPLSLVPAILIQQCWVEGLDWDQPLSNHLKVKWENWCDDVRQLASFKLGRKVLEGSASNSTQYFLHVFCDASEAAYGVVACLVSNDSNSLIVSRAKVAPVKKLTLARLELLALVIGARLLSYLKDVYSDLNLSAYLWSDSRVAIAWAQSPVFQLKTWLANRVQEIQDLIDPARVLHCPGKENPADLCSRGTTAATLRSSTLWWRGPSWLAEWSPKGEAENREDMGAEELMLLRSEQRKQPPNVAGAAAAVDSGFSQWVQRFSSLIQLLRVTAWIQRYIFNWKHPQAERRTGPLKAQELSTARLWWIRQVQSEVFPEEVRLLAAGKRPKGQSALVGCCLLLLDKEDGLIKVKGRTVEATNFSNSIPVLPTKHRFVDLLIKDAHERRAHSWVEDTYNQISYHVWILRGRQRVKSVLNECMVCRMLSKRPVKQPTGQLPGYRCNVGEPFETTGVDFFGPLFVKSESGVMVKRYACLFVCARVRAVHLESVQDMSTQKFLFALERFLARRGRCRELISDNARTFHRANQVLQSAWRQLRASNHQVADYLSQKGIEWRFIPERAPWWGGFWERLVQSVKIPLRKLIGKSVLAEDELVTKLLQVEITVNSRPLTFVTTDQRDPEPLSPFCILTGKRNHQLPTMIDMAVPSGNVSASDLRRKVKGNEEFSDAFWKCWSKVYRQKLRQYYQLDSFAREWKIGEIVRIKDDNAPRLCWRLGRITKVFRSSIDGVIRAVMVKTSTRLLRRAVDCLIPLEVEGAEIPPPSAPESLASPDNSMSPSNDSTQPPTGSSECAESSSEMEEASVLDSIANADSHSRLNSIQERRKPNKQRKEEMRAEPNGPSHGGEDVRFSTRSGRQCRPNRKYPVADMFARWQQRKEADMDSDTGPTTADDN